MSLTVEQLANVTCYSADSIPGATKFFPMLPPWPFKNMNIWRLMTWKVLGSGHMSEAVVIHLVDDILFTKDFSLEDLQVLNVHIEMKHFHRSKDALNINDTFQ